jgi:response regulator RpfG family c-di-GMP phosphodiesterase
MASPIKKRHVLILLIATAQAACLFIATMMFNSTLQRSIESRMYDQVLADNILLAGQLSKLISKLDVADLRDNPISWEKLQGTIRNIDLPNEGFVCLVDAADGSLLCHPDLNALPGSQTAPKMVKPGMVKPAMPKKTMIKPAMVKPAMKKPEMSEPTATKPQMKKPTMAATDEVQGTIELYAGELQIIAAGFIPELNAHVKVHQKAVGIKRTISKILKSFLPLSMVFSLSLIGCTSAVIIGLMRRYDNRVATINEGLEATVARRTETIRKTRDAVVFGLAKLSESRDNDTGQHLDRIQLYVAIIASHLSQSDSRIDKNYLDNLVIASSLHDIGKVGVPDQILLKPGGFTPEERQIMETHAMIGGKCLAAVGEQLGADDFLQLAREIAFSHHEKWDGSGYPYGLIGEAIPLSGRIVALADVYDALRSRRPYKAPMPHEKAKAIILEGNGLHFDPDVVTAFLECEELFLEVSEHYAKTPDSECSNLLQTT